MGPGLPSCECRRDAAAGDMGVPPLQPFVRAGGPRPLVSELRRSVMDDLRRSDREKV